METKFIVALCLVFLLSCSKERQDTILRSVNYTGDQLKIHNGLYGRVDIDSIGIQVYFLYLNGHTLLGGYPTWEQLAEFQQKGEWPGFPGSGKTRYGIFNIDDSKITIEDYFASNDGPLRTVVKEGNVINDTTFVVNIIRNNFYNESTEVNHTYKFYPFSPKPDSTNNYIK